MLTIQQVIEEADVLLPNGYEAAQKISWLNSINKEFFEIVKVPSSVNLPYGPYVDMYVLPDYVRKRNISLVQFGGIYEAEVQPGRNVWTFDETTHEITLQPAPLTEGIGYVHYYQVAITTFTLANQSTDKPDAAAEYHWVYTLGLCERIAKADEDLARANHYAKEYQNALNVAAQNYRGGQRAN